MLGWALNISDLHNFEMHQQANPDNRSYTSIFPVIVQDSGQRTRRGTRTRQ